MTDIATPARMPARTEYEPPAEPDPEPDEPPAEPEPLTTDTDETPPALLTAPGITRAVAAPAALPVTECPDCHRRIGRMARRDVRCPRRSHA
jgi:hypothetical protein